MESSFIPSIRQNDFFHSFLPLFLIAVTLRLFTPSYGVGAENADDGVAFPFPELNYIKGEITPAQIRQRK